MNFAIYFFLGICLFLILILIYFRDYFFTSFEEKKAPANEKPNPKKKVPCILCGSSLSKGETLKSEEYKGEKESIVHIYGCKNCHGDEATKERTCPICKKDLKVEDHLLGRMWKRKNGKLHLHVSGCTMCKK